jgi:hypothetical protein
MEVKVGNQRGQVAAQVNHLTNTGVREKADRLRGKKGS